MIVNALCSCSVKDGFRDRSALFIFTPGLSFITNQDAPSRRVCDFLQLCATRRTLPRRTAAPPHRRESPALCWVKCGCRISRRNCRRNRPRRLSASQCNVSSDAPAPPYQTLNWPPPLRVAVDLYQVVLLERVAMKTSTKVANILGHIGCLSIPLLMFLPAAAVADWVSAPQAHGKRIRKG